MDIEQYSSIYTNFYFFTEIITLFPTLLFLPPATPIPPFVSFQIDDFFLFVTSTSVYINITTTCSAYLLLLFLFIFFKQGISMESWLS